MAWNSAVKSTKIGRFRSEADIAETTPADSSGIGAFAKQADPVVIGHQHVAAMWWRHCWRRDVMSSVAGVLARRLGHPVYIADWRTQSRAVDITLKKTTLISIRLHWTAIPCRRQDFRRISISGVCDSVILKLQCQQRKLQQIKFEADTAIGYRRRSLSVLTNYVTLWPWPLTFWTLSLTTYRMLTHQPLHILWISLIAQYALDTNASCLWCTFAMSRDLGVRCRIPPNIWISNPHLSVLPRLVVWRSG